MRIILFLLLLLTTIVFGCQESKQDMERTAVVNTVALPDTIVGSINISDEIAGSAYRTKATSYFLIIDKDTSDFRPILTKYKDNNNIWLDLNLPYTNSGESQSRRMEELKQILPMAAKKYRIDSLTGVAIGRLILTGDLAIQVTNQYTASIGAPKQIRTADYDKISEFLLHSQLATDFNELLQPYSLTVDKIRIEKVFFASLNELYRYNVIKTDSAVVPNQILDCLTSLRVKKE